MACVADVTRAAALCAGVASVSVSGNGASMARVSVSASPFFAPGARALSASVSQVRVRSAVAPVVVDMAKREEELVSVRKMSDEDINQTVVDLKGELFILRSKQATRQEFKSSEFRRIRKNVRSVSFQGIVDCQPSKEIHVVCRSKHIQAYPSISSFCRTVTLSQVRVVPACFHFILVCAFASFCGALCSECQCNRQLYLPSISLYRRRCQLFRGCSIQSRQFFFHSVVALFSTSFTFFITQGHIL
ncbi:hypothetical protein M758_7G160600 [Ceratodon purpureus]|nr:hypothetical protein M758_7G160600 [Ceratodon purpureus]